MSSSTFGNTVAIAMLSTVGAVLIAWVNNRFGKLKNKAETDNIIVNAAERAVAILDRRVESLVLELQESRQESVNARHALKYTEAVLSATRQELSEALDEVHELHQELIKWKGINEVH